MGDKSYQTIDPLIMETLHLNEKRIHHIFDILHGRDIQPHSNRSYHYQQKNASRNQIETHEKTKSPRQLTYGNKADKIRASSVKKMSSPLNLSKVSAKLKLEKKEKEMVE